MAGMERVCFPGVGDTFGLEPEDRTPQWGPLLHRWGSAFPGGAALTQEEAFLPESRLLFCGDFVGERAGTIEGALLSGRRGAESLRKHLS
mmetsp:Transcript_14687/g.44133  ORF Transcript_14687/g.44133 Transcript_14687/m.44133 type:complete len:90 (+) Transcript_14687:992-1261(+)